MTGGLTHLAAFAHLAFFGVFVPLGAYRTRKRFAAATAPLDRRRHYLAVIPQLMIFAGLSLAVAFVERIRLFPPTLPPARYFALGAAIVAVLVIAMYPRWRRAVQRGDAVVQLFMPATRDERVLWTCIALLAGVSEEITWRGVQHAILLALVRSWWTAAVIAALMFALAHLAQGWRSAAVIFPFALLFHAVCYLTGSLYVAMCIHAAYDLAAGFGYAHLAKAVPRSTSESLGVPRGE